MKNLALIARMEIQDSITDRWFLLYSIVFGGTVVALFLTGITESRIMGFMGISRLLLTYFQLCIVVLPIFILVTTVRSIVGDRESNVLEYLLSMPISFSDYFWGRLVGRFIVIVVPILGALLMAAVWATIKGLDVEWETFGIYCLLLTSMSWCFLGMAMLIALAVRHQETGLGIAFFAWLVLVMFLDIVLISVFLQYQVNPELVIGMALVNPLQDFRVASMSLFDPDLTMLGPSSWFILQHFGKAGFILFSILYPIIAGFLMAFAGVSIFRRRDVV